MMDWTRCFSARRYGVPYDDEKVRTEFERDWDRIIFSSPFRRLQNKTQVFPLPEEVFVHNRLTHSLEVASVGRSLGKLAGDYLASLPVVARDPRASMFYREHLKHVIAAACLAHDLGNPAFGHSGEEAISRYFRSRDTGQADDATFRKQFSPAEWSDLTHFEGNANALRILTRQFTGRLPGGFGLTYSTLGAIIKYPCESLASTGKGGPSHRRKFGFFKDDQDIFLEVAEALNMIREAHPEWVIFKRHPFVCLVEAADDICYHVIDLEDAHRLGILSFETVAEFFLRLLRAGGQSDMDLVHKRLTGLRSDSNESLAYLRAKVINSLTLQCAQSFFDHRAAILDGEYESALVDDLGEATEVMREIAGLSYRQIYNHREVVKIEIAGFRIMSGLVKDFVEAALTPASLRSVEQQKVLSLLPGQYVFDEACSPYQKVMHMLDFVSGMTDLYAIKLYRNLRGISI